MTVPGEVVPGRSERHSGKPVGSDQRTPGQRDRDRILYSLAFRRLANVTQVVAPIEGYVFHNRLTHSLEVAQIARRLAEHFRETHPECRPDLDPDVVECAALAHDLGHPPFGHAAEEELRRLAVEVHHLADGFEGNAQSFRIVTRLAELNPGTQRGLDLTRASLNAVLKYPWTVGKGPADRDPKKFGVYDSEENLFLWVRSLGPAGLDQCCEAQLMDLADDIGYSVHDVDDFYRAGLLPIDQLAGDQNAFLDFIGDWDRDKRTKLGAAEIRQLKNLLDLLRLGLPYEGTRTQRAGLRSFTSSQIGRFVRAITLKPDPVTRWRASMEPARALEVAFLKRLVWVYVITNRRLASVQAGQKRVVRELVEFYVGAMGEGNFDVLPPLFRDDVSELGKGTSKEHVRLAIDMVAGLADEQATRLARRISGVEAGSIHDRVDS